MIFQSVPVGLRNAPDYIVGPPSLSVSSSGKVQNIYGASWNNRKRLEEGGREGSPGSERCQMWFDGGGGWKKKTKGSRRWKAIGSDETATAITIHRLPRHGSSRRYEFRCCCNPSPRVQIPFWLLLTMSWSSSQCVTQQMSNCFFFLFRE